MVWNNAPQVNLGIPGANLWLTLTLAWNNRSLEASLT